MASLENALVTPSPLFDDAPSISNPDGGGNTVVCLLGRRAKKRRPCRRLGPYGAILLMSTLVQRSMAAGGFFKVRATRIFDF